MLQREEKKLKNRRACTVGLRDVVWWTRCASFYVKLSENILFHMWNIIAESNFKVNGWILGIW